MVSKIEEIEKWYFVGCLSIIWWMDRKCHGHSHGKKIGQVVLCLNILLQLYGHWLSTYPWNCSSSYVTSFVILRTLPLRSRMGWYQESVMSTRLINLWMCSHIHWHEAYAMYIGAPSCWNNSFYQYCRRGIFRNFGEKNSENYNFPKIFRKICIAVWCRPDLMNSASYCHYFVNTPAAEIGCLYWEPVR